MRARDARCTRQGTGMAGTESGTEAGDEHKYGFPGSGWRVQNGH